MRHPLIIALQFLTRIPLPTVADADDRAVGRSLLWYPVVGLLIGVALFALAALLADGSTLLSAALLLALWVTITGGLHLDGVADSADAWIGGIGNRERTLAIMKDPRCGAAAVVAVVVLLLVKFAALEAVVAQQQPGLLLIVPVLARAAILLLFLTTPYVRPGGIASVLTQHMPRQAMGWVLVALMSLIALLLGWQGIGLLMVALVGLAGLRYMMQRRVGGTTGDTAGAVIEVIEALLLVSIALL